MALCLRSVLTSQEITGGRALTTPEPSLDSDFGTPSKWSSKPRKGCQMARRKVRWWKRLWSGIVNHRKGVPFSYWLNCISIAIAAASLWYARNSYEYAIAAEQRA